MSARGMFVRAGGGLHRLPLGKTHLRVTDKSQGRETTPEWGLKNEAPARAYTTSNFSLLTGAPS